MAISPKFLLAVAALTVGLVDSQLCTGKTPTGPCNVGGTCPTPGEVCDQSVPLPRGPQCCRTTADVNPYTVNGKCVDKAANCAQKSSLCKYAIHAEVMSKECAATCGLCSDGRQL